MRSKNLLFWNKEELHEDWKESIAICTYPDKAKYLVMSRNQNTERSYSIKIDNSSFEKAEELKYLGTTVTKQSSIQEEIKSRLESGNACYHSMQNLLSSIVLSKNIKIEVYRTIILPVVFAWV